MYVYLYCDVGWLFENINQEGMCVWCKIKLEASRDMSIKVKVGHVDIFPHVLSDHMFEDIKKNDYVFHYKQVNSWLVIKVKNYTETEKLGLEASSGEMKALKDEIGDSSLFKIAVIVFNCNNNDVYFNTSLNRAEEIMNCFFDFKNLNGQIIPEADLKEFAELSRITITEYLGRPHSFDQIDDKPWPIEDITGLSESCSVKKIQTDYSITLNRGLSHTKLEKFALKNGGGNRTICIIGNDRNGNKISYNAQGKFTKQIDLDLDVSAFDDISQIKEELIIQSIMDKIERH